MKKLLLVLLTVCSLLLLTSCNTLEGLMKDIGSLPSIDEILGDGEGNTDIPDEGGSTEKPDVPGGNTQPEDDPNGSGSTDNPGTGEDPDLPNDNEEPRDDNEDNKADPDEDHVYLDFTSNDKALFTRYIGALIPFIPNDEYYIEGYYDTADYEHGINFYTVGNTEAEFEAYRALYADYTLSESYVDDFGDTWYTYVLDDVVVDLSYYEYLGELYVDVYVYSSLSTDIDDGSGEGGSTDNPGEGGGNDGEVDTGNGWEELYDCITVEEALAICEMTGSTKSDRYYLIATVVSIDDDYYGQMTVKDATGSILVYGTYGADGVDRFGDLSDVPSVGDTVLFYGNFMSYYGTPEMYSGWIIDYTGKPAGGGGSAGGDTDTDTNRLYNDFTADEKDIFNTYIGAVIPFIPNDDYYVEGYYYTDDFEHGVNYYTFGNTNAEFEFYRSSYIVRGYTLEETYEDSYGDTWYTYVLDDVVVDLSYYYYEGDYVVDVYVYSSLSTDIDGGSDDPGTGDDPDVGGEDGTEHTYTDFTSEEHQLILDTLGMPLPFIPCDLYYLDEYELGDEIGLNYYTFDNTEAEFAEFLERFTSYTFIETYEDEYGDTWYSYSADDVYIDVSFYYDGESSYVMDLYAYFIIENGEGGDSGNTGGDISDNSDLITNEGAGLPEGTDGVYDVDFTEAENVRDVTDQGYYIDGCPTTGSPAVLVIPVEFSDSPASSKGYSTDALKEAFMMGGETDYYSVYDYYYLSSYGKLELDITVLDFWFRPENNSSYYYNATYDYYGEDIAIGDQLVLDEALAYLAGIMDLSDYDSDGNGIIDAVVLINTLDIGEEDFYWAYRYWNLYTDSDGYYYEYDGVSANDYLWASYQFLNEGYDENGETYYDASIMNTYTFIHEFAHILGADDYYDTEYESDPMSGCDVMDTMLGDHNAYTKINLGWITSSRLVVTGGTLTLTLSDFGATGDTIIIGNNFDPKLGAYQEYYILAYYRNTGLNAPDAGYFLRDGVVVYHVNASLYKEEIDGEIYYDVYNNNTSSSSDYGTEDNLIEYVKSAADTFTYAEGDTLPEIYDDLGKLVSITFTVDSLTDEYATITFSAR